MGDSKDSEVEDQGLNKSQISVKSIGVANGKQAQGSWSRAERSCSGSAEKSYGLNKSNVASRKLGSRMRVPGVDTNANVTPKSSHKERHDVMNRS